MLISLVRSVFCACALLHVGRAAVQRGSVWDLMVDVLNREASYLFFWLLSAPLRQFLWGGWHEAASVTSWLTARMLEELGRTSDVTTVAEAEGARPNRPTSPTRGLGARTAVDKPRTTTRKCFIPVTTGNANTVAGMFSTVWSVTGNAHIAAIVLSSESSRREIATTPRNRMPQVQQMRVAMYRNLFVISGCKL